MRKAFLIIMIAGIILFSSCQRIYEMPDQQMFSNEHLHFGEIGSVSDETLYYVPQLEPGMLCYADLKNRQSGILCGKPECNHQTVSCNGYLGDKESDYAVCLGVSAYKNEIYYILNNGNDISLYKMNIDGSSHRKMRNFALVESGSFPVSGQQPFVHQGYVFTSGVVSNIVNGEYYSTLRVVAYPIDHSDEEIVIYTETNNDFCEAKLMPLNNHLFFVIQRTASGSSDNMPVEVEMYSWNLEERKTENIYSGRLPDALYEWGIQDQEFVFTGYSDSRLYYFSLVDKDFTEIRYFDGPDTGFMTEYIGGDYIIGFQYPTEETVRIRIEDFKGEVILDHTYDKMLIEKGHAARTFAGIYNSQALFFYLGDDRKSESLLSLDMGTGKREILWTETGNQ